MRQRLGSALGLLLALVTLGDLAAAEVPTPPATERAMTLREAVDHAHLHHERLLAARRRLIAAQREADVPGAQWLPRVGAFAQVIGATTNNSTTTLLGVSTVDIPRIGATRIESKADFSPSPSTAIAVGVRQQIYDFGRVAAESAAASLMANIERSRGESVALDVDFFVEQAYYAVLAATAVEGASRGAFERATAHRDLARANVTTGLRPPIELTRAEADVARYEAGMTRARGALRVARAVFAASAAVDDTELGAAGAPPEALALPSLVDVLRRAEASPSVREVRDRVLAQRGETRRLDTQNRPVLYGTAAVNGRAGGATPSAGPVPSGDGWVPLVPNYDVGVVLAWPILEPTWDRRADASRERERALEAESALALREQRLAITAAWQEAEITGLTLAALERGADAARANYEQAEQRFRVGLGTSTEVADAQALRTEADIQLAIGRFQKARARVVLARVTAEAR